MRKSFLRIMFATLAVMAITVSCSKDDNGGGGIDVSADQIIGIWDLVYEKYVFKEDGIIVYEAEYDFEPEEETMVFYEDGTAEFFISGYYVDQCEWKISRGKLYLGSQDEDNGWSEVPIVNLTSTEMVLERTDKYTEYGVKHVDYLQDIYQKRQ